MARSDRSRRRLFVVAFFVSAAGVGTAGACSAVPDVTYFSTDAPPGTSASSSGQPDAPIDTGVKDGGQDVSAMCNATYCCGTEPCVGCKSVDDCALCQLPCGGNNVCCRDEAGVRCRPKSQCQ